MSLSKKGGYVYSQDYQPVAELKLWQASIEDGSESLSCINKDRAQGKEVTTEAEIQLRNNSDNTRKIKKAEEKMTGKAA